MGCVPAFYSAKPAGTHLLGLLPIHPCQDCFVVKDNPISHPSDLAGKRIGAPDSAMRILDGQPSDHLMLDPGKQTLVTLGNRKAHACMPLAAVPNVES